jgi:RNA polymerase sigma-70 factor (ECF subfamily)
MQRELEILSVEEERKLVERAKRDPRAFGEIYERHFDAIFGFVQHRIASVAEAEDLVAQVFTNALGNMWRFRWSGVSISAWLYRIAANEMHSLHRSRARQPAGHPDDAGNTTDSALVQTIELSAAEDMVAQHELYCRLHECLSTLSPQDHTLLVLRYFEGKPHKEIAEILGTRVGAVRTRTGRALAKLKKVLEDRGIDYGRDGNILEAGTHTESLGTPLQTGAEAQVTGL